MIVIMIIREIISQTYSGNNWSRTNSGLKPAYGLANRAITVLACFRIQDTSGGFEPPYFLCICSTFFILIGLLCVSLNESEGA